MKKTHLPPLGIAAALALFSSSAVSASTVFSADFESATQARADVPIAMGATLAAGYSVTNLVDGGTPGNYRLDAQGTDGTGSQLIYDQGNFANFLPGAGDIADLTTAITGNSYYEFTLSNASAFSLQSIGLTVIQFGYVNGAIDRETGAYVFTNLTSDFTTPGTSFDASESLGQIVRGPSIAQGVESGTITLAGNAALEDITSVTFRVYLTEGYTGTSGNRRAGIDDLSVAVIPEPSAYALLGGVLAFGFAALRRRK